MLDLSANPILLTDGYKPRHADQYPPGTDAIYSHMVARGGEDANVMFFGLQYILTQYMEGRRVDVSAIAEAKDILNPYGGPGMMNIERWSHIAADHGGVLPLRIRSVEEGTRVRINQPLWTVENTCPKCFWVTNYFESLLEHTWFGSSVLTNSDACYAIIDSYARETGTPSETVFRLHDFGFRGVSSVESAAIGGAAHLVRFRGSDTIIALKLLRNVYYKPVTQDMASTIPATEHSTITSWGREHEVDAFRHMLETYPTGAVAVVSDSYDIEKAIDHWGSDRAGLRDRVLKRDGVLIIRPDSPWQQGMGVSETVIKVLYAVAREFGYQRNDKGFMLLDPHVRIIQGDGVNREIIDETLHEMQRGGWSSDNLYFGMGGALLQKLNRDTHKFAVKCSWASVDGVGRNVFKSPRGAKDKHSHAGRYNDAKMPIRFEDGVLYNTTSLDRVRSFASA